MKLYQVKSTVDTARRRQEPIQHRDIDRRGTSHFLPSVVK